MEKNEFVNFLMYKTARDIEDVSLNKLIVRIINII